MQQSADDVLGVLGRVRVCSSRASCSLFFSGEKLTISSLFLFSSLLKSACPLPKVWSWISLFSNPRKFSVALSSPCRSDKESEISFFPSERAIFFIFSKRAFSTSCSGRPSVHKKEVMIRERGLSSYSAVLRYEKSPLAT